MFIIKSSIFISNIWVVYKHKCSQVFCAYVFIRGYFNNHNFLPIIQILGFYKSTYCRKTMKILHAYVLHHNSRNLFHISAMKQYHFLFNLRKLIFCLTVMLIYVIAHIQLHFLLLFRIKEKVMKIIQCQMDCPIIKGTKNVSFEAHQILLQCFYGIFGLTKSYVNALNANQ